MMGQVQRSLTCPITLKDLEKPVKNMTCGHIYSKDGKERYNRTGTLAPNFKNS